MQSHRPKDLDLDDDDLPFVAEELLEDPLAEDDDESLDDDAPETPAEDFVPKRSKKSDGQVAVEEETYDPENWEGVHPAEIAARLQRQMRGDRVVRNSDEAILRELRTAVFSVPLMPQKEVSRLFNLVDAEVKPLVYDVMASCQGTFEEVFQVVLKVAAGNTYGKNIYEKSDNPEPESAHKSTYKKHELDFLANASRIFEVFSQERSSSADISTAMESCLFIRGVYEEALDSFLAKTKTYTDLHWRAFELRLSQDHEGLAMVVDSITAVDDLLEAHGPVFGLVLRARKTKANFASTRAKIIAPYLRSVYSQAKKTAKNAQQMLENFQNGSIGLIRAISCYSTRRTASFASVAKWWIKQMMLLSIKEDANFVKLPVSTWQAYTQLEKARAKLNCAEEDIELIAKEAKMPSKKAKSVYDTVKIAQVYSLNRTYDADEKLTLEDIITNENKLGHVENEFDDLVRFYCERAELSLDETKMLALRHGMFDILETYAPAPDLPEVVRESVIQNLANLGYRYRPKTPSATL